MLQALQAVGTLLILAFGVVKAMEHNQNTYQHPQNEWVYGTGRYNGGVGGSAAAAEFGAARAEVAGPEDYNIYDVNNLAQAFHNQDMADLWNAQQHQAAQAGYLYPQYAGPPNVFHEQQPQLPFSRQKAHDPQLHQQTQRQRQHHLARPIYDPMEAAGPTQYWDQSWQDANMAAEMASVDLQPQQPYQLQQEQQRLLQGGSSRHVDQAILQQEGQGDDRQGEDQEVTSKLRFSKTGKRMGRPPVAKPEQEQITWWHEWPDKEEVALVFAIVKARVLGEDPGDRKKEIHLEKRIKELLSDTDAAMMLHGSPAQQQNILDRFQINERRSPIWFDGLKKDEKKQLLEMHKYVHGTTVKYAREYIYHCISFNDCQAKLAKDYDERMERQALENAMNSGEQHGDVESASA